MRGLDTTKWSLWDWIGAASLLLAALVLAFNGALKDAPAFASKLPDFLSTSLWAYVPLALLVIAFAAIVFRPTLPAAQVAPEAMLAAGQDDLIPFSYESSSDFKLLPQQYSADLTAPLPYIEARFYVVNFQAT